MYPNVTKLELLVEVPQPESEEFPPLPPPSAESDRWDLMGIYCASILQASPDILLQFFALFWINQDMLSYRDCTRMYRTSIVQTFCTVINL